MATLTPQELAEAASQAARLTLALEKAKDVFGTLTDSAKEVLNISKSLEKSYKDLAESAYLREQGEKKQLSYAQQLQAQLEKIKKNLKDQTDSSVKISSELAKQQSQQSTLNLLQRNATNAVRQQEAIVKRARGANRIAQQDLLDQARDQLNEVIKQKNATDDVVKGLQDAQQAADGFKNATEEELKLLEKAAKKATFKELTEGMKKSLESLLGFKLTLAGIAFVLFNADKSTTKLANNLGLSREAAQGIRNEFSAFVRSANDAGLSTEKLIEAQLSLSQELGTAVRFSNDELQTFNTLTTVMGVSNAAAAKLNLIAKASGTEYKNIQSNILKGAIATKNQLGVAISNRDVFEEIGKLSSGILVKFQNNPPALGAAVVQARKLGLTLEQVNNIGESLLNWESSIENELKAELLTNRELNLERARAAALTGDQATLMKEVAAQAGSLEDFTKLNVIAQGALAGAFGMTSDQMAEMLMKQELINQYGSKAAELNKEQAEEFKKSGLSLDDYLKKQGAQVALQEQFNNSIEQLKELVVTLVQGPFGTLVGMLVKSLDVITSMVVVFGSLYGLFKASAAIESLVLGFQVARAAAQSKQLTTQATLNLLKGEELATQIGIAAAWVIANPFQALVGLVAAAGVTALVASAMSSTPKTADDMIQPGYGKRILFSPEGSIAFNDKDTIVAGTNLKYGNDVIYGPAGSIGNNDGLMAGIRELINVTKQGRVSTIDGQVFSREGNRVLNMYTSPHYS